MTAAPLLLTSPDGSLTVEFYWKEDRLAHRVIARDSSSGAVEVMQSIEGTADQAWPCSPPIQQLTLENLQLGEALLGVGAAGTSHWSISVHWEPNPHHPTLKFDLACRCRTLPESLGSSYQANEALIVTTGPCCTTQRHSDVLSIHPQSVAETGTICWSYLVRRQASPHR